MKKYKNGFTKVEMLIIGGIIGLLGVVSIFMIDASQKRTRDAQRLSDIRQIEAGMQMYYTAGASYVGSCAEEVERQVTKTTFCKNNNYINWNRYRDPSNDNRIACDSSSPTKDCRCSYGIEITNDNEYYIFFCLEKGTDNVPSGLNFISKHGINR